MENLKTQNTKEMNEGIETFADFEESRVLLRQEAKVRLGVAITRLRKIPALC